MNYKEGRKPMLEYESFGLNAIFEEENLLDKYIRYTVENGKCISGYEGLYIIKSYGKIDFDLYLSQVQGKDEFSVEVSHIELIANGNCVWKLKVTDIDTECFTDVPLDRYIAFSDCNNEGTIIVHLLNSDVIPSYCPGEIIEMQIAGISAGAVNYYENEDQYSDSVRRNKHDFILAVGSVIPYGLISGDDRGLSLIVGKVKYARCGKFVIKDDDGIDSCIITTIETNYGDLDLVHSFDQVSEDDLKLIKEGSVIAGYFYLTGDVAINKYDEGFICSAENNLKAFQYSIYSGNFRRLSLILNDSVIYHRDVDNTSIEGKCDVIEYLQNIVDNTSHNIYSYSATINNVPENDVLSAGEKCLILAYDDEQNLENVIKLSYDDKGRIKRIDSIRKTKATFDIETYSRNIDQLNVTDNSLEKAVYCRAELLGFINGDNMSYEEYIDRYESVQKDKEETVLKYIGNIDIDRLDKDEQYRENCFAEFFRQNIGEKLDYFDKDDQELINLKSGKFSIDYHYRTEIIKEMESLEALKKVMFMMTVIADEMISNNLN